MCTDDPLQYLEIPPELEINIQRHRENLARLVVSLRRAGISEAQIEESVAVIVASYKEELIASIKALAR